MGDLMLTAVLSMPYDMAMADDLSRRQFYDRAQQALEEIERLTAERDELRRQLAEAEQDARRLNWLDDQWQDPIHLEVGTRRVNEYRLERECVLFLPIGETRGSDVRAAIDAAMGASNE